MVIGTALGTIKRVPKLDVAYSFLMLFNEDTSIGGDSKDKIKVYVAEPDKYRKYTSVMFPATDYKLAAISEWVPNYEVHSDKVVAGKTTTKVQRDTWRGDNYNWLDQKAYEQKGSLNYWNELIYYHELYGMTLKVPEIN